MKFRKGVAAACAALAVQVAAVGWLVWRYERVVLLGEEVRMKCRAYDPYDPLRGRYLRVSVDGDCRNILFEYNPEETWRRISGDVFAKLAKSPDGLWRVEAVAREPGADGLWVKRDGARLDYVLEYGDKRDGEDYEAFHKRRKASGIKAEVSFPGQLFVNEKIAPAAEKLIQEKASSAIAVYRVLDGRIVLTGIEIDGRSVQSAVKE